MELVVRYTPPDELDFDEVVLQSGDVLVIGRHPGPEGIELYEADRTISRVAVELSLVDDGVRVRNRNRYLSIQLGNLDYAGMDLAPGEAHTLSRSGWVTIPDQHHIKFELSGSAPGDPTTTLSGSTTLTDSVTGAWEQLHRNYRQTCAALVVAWFIEDFTDIAPRTPPTNFHIGILLGVSQTEANHKLERTKSRLGRLLEEEFIGEQGKLHIAQWVIRGNLVTRVVVEQLPGIDQLVRRA